MSMYKVMAFRSVGYMFKFSILCFCKSVLYATFVKVLCCSNAIDYQDKTVVVSSHSQSMGH